MGTEKKQTVKITALPGQNVTLKERSVSVHCKIRTVTIDDFGGIVYRAEGSADGKHSFYEFTEKDFGKTVFDDENRY
jgi:hypothetical protein